ncbi:hypothetical protein BT69DRAFT_433222 [Atractiella rhizophila]|nr:hypothetical protein BT69DRAFT_433222 [Atractiella rhizophila]
MTGQGCENCKVSTSCRWRKDEAGKRICNACGLYYMRNGKHRIMQATNKRHHRREIVRTPTPQSEAANPQLYPHPHFSSAAVRDHRGFENSHRNQPSHYVFPQPHDAHQQISSAAIYNHHRVQERRGGLKIPSGRDLGQQMWLYGRCS